MLMSCMILLLLCFFSVFLRVSGAELAVLDVFLLVPYFAINQGIYGDYIYM